MIKHLLLLTVNQLGIKPGAKTQRSFYLVFTLQMKMAFLLVYFQKQSD